MHHSLFELSRYSSRLLSCSICWKLLLETTIGILFQISVDQISLTKQNNKSVMWRCCQLAMFLSNNNNNNNNNKATTKCMMAYLFIEIMCWMCYPAKLASLVILGYIYLITGTSIYIDFYLWMCWKVITSSLSEHKNTHWKNLKARDKITAGQNMEFIYLVLRNSFHVPSLNNGFICNWNLITVVIRCRSCKYP